MTKRGEKGNALIEFALGFTVLWACFSGVFEFGYSMYVYNGLLNAVRNGASFAARTDYDVSNGGAVFNARTRNFVVYGDPAGGSQPLVPGLGTSNVVVTASPSGQKPDSITVSVSGFRPGSLFAITNYDINPNVTVPYMGTPKF